MVNYDRSISVSHTGFNTASQLYRNSYIFIILRLYIVYMHHTVNIAGNMLHSSQSIYLFIRIVIGHIRCKG